VDIIIINPDRLQLSFYNLLESHHVSFVPVLIKTLHFVSY